MAVAYHLGSGRANLEASAAWHRQEMVLPNNAMHPCSLRNPWLPAHTRPAPLCCSEGALRELPPVASSSEYVIPPAELAARRDLRGPEYLVCRQGGLFATLVARQFRWASSPTCDAHCCPIIAPGVFLQGWRQAVAIISN